MSKDATEEKSRLSVRLCGICDTAAGVDTILCSVYKDRRAYLLRSSQHFQIG